MAWRHHRIWIIAVLLLSGLALAWAIAQTPMPPPPAEQVATTTPDLVGNSIYTNGEYGFAVVYPAAATIETEFVASDNLSDAWRVHAIGSGMPVVAITTYAIEHDTAYPRSYTTLVRIGASMDAKELAQCERVTSDRGEAMLPDAQFGGATWKAFSFGDAAMMRYVKGVSYRTVHNGTCYAIEKIATGSSYREDASGDDIPQEELDAAYAALDAIVMSFTFAR